MTEKDIWEFFPFLYNHRITSQRTVRLDALSRMCIAYNDLICMLACNDYEHQRKITRKIDSLYHVIDGSTINGLVQKYRLTKEVTMAAYGPKDEACSELYYRLVDKYLKRPATAEPHSDAWYFATSYAVTQCCADLIDQAQREMMQQIA